MGFKKIATISYIRGIRKEVRFKEFLKLAAEAFAALPDDFKPFVDLDEFTKDETFHVKTQKVGVNDPCPCGSGKKYKKCCGR
jgi:uncharacterized protein YecA (UPF0149 family)